MGFCYLKYLGVSAELIAATQASWMPFFSLFESFKRQCGIAKAPRYSGLVDCAENGMYVDEALRLDEACDIGLELPY
jgi:hypothetical protein